MKERAVGQHLLWPWLTFALLVACESSDAAVGTTGGAESRDPDASVPESGAPGLGGNGSAAIVGGTAAPEPESEPETAGHGGNGGSAGFSGPEPGHIGGARSVGGAGPGTSGASGSPAENACGGGGADANEAQEPPPQPPALWNEHSIRVYVDDAGFWGSERVEQEVEWLTAEQVNLLETMEFEFFQADPCRLLLDGSDITVTVTDDDGSMRIGQSTTNHPESEWQVRDIGAFLNTFECRGGIYYNASPLNDPLETAPVFPPNDGCHHRFRDAGWFATEVAAPGTHHLALSGECDEMSSIRVHAPTTPVAAVETMGPLDAGSSVLGESDLREDGSCPTLVVELPEPGLYPVYVVGGDDTYLRVTSEGELTAALP